ncbi:MAG: LysM peptidoglycan-binding domain-containing protein [Verrucomicrobiales bacterium]
MARFLTVILIIAVLGASGWVLWKRLPPDSTTRLALEAFVVRWLPDWITGASEDSQAEEPEDPSRPDPMRAVFAEVVPLLRARQWSDARQALLNNEGLLPQSRFLQTYKSLLGELNLLMLMNLDPAEDNVQMHTVRPGEAISILARRYRISSDMLMRLNGLSSINLRIGQELLIPTISFSALVQTDAGLLTLFNNDVFFKEYQILETQLPPNFEQGEIITVREKSAWHQKQRVAFGNTSFYLASPVIYLSRPGLAIYPVDTSGEENFVKPAAGFGISPEDIQEVFFLLTGNDKVQID